MDRYLQSPAKRGRGGRPVAASGRGRGGGGGGGRGRGGRGRGRGAGSSESPGSKRSSKGTPVS